MRAAVLREFGGRLAIEEVPDPETGPDGIIVRVASGGVCHSDLHMLHGRRRGFPALPWVPGHEIAGYVESVGPAVRGVDVGRAVLIYAPWGCGSCRVCAAGDEQLCDVSRWLGFGAQGGFAERVRVGSARHLVPIDGLDPSTAGPLADAGVTPYRAARRVVGDVRPDGSVIVIGAGGLGQFGVQYLRMMTPARIVVVDVSQSRADIALGLGADVAVVAQGEEAVARIREAVGPSGADAVLDFVGSDATLAVASSCVAQGGAVVLVGLAGGSLPLSFFGVSAEARISTSRWASRRDLVEVVDLAERGLVRMDVEHHQLEEIADVFDAMDRGELTGRAVINP